MSKGISGSGDGFDLPGRRLGGFSHQPPLSSLRRTALAAAENRARQGPSGPKRVGGDKSIMSALTPTQAAAMAAERRLQDDIWCGLEEIVEEEESRAQVQHAQNVTSSSSDKTNQKRGPHSESCFVDLTSSPTSNKRSRHEFDDLERTCIDLTSSASASTGGCDNDIHESSSGWECMMCTLLNPVRTVLNPSCSVFALICCYICKTCLIMIYGRFWLRCVSSVEPTNQNLLKTSIRHGHVNFVRWKTM